MLLGKKKKLPIFKIMNPAQPVSQAFIQFVETITSTKAQPKQNYLHILSKKQKPKTT